MCLARIIDTSNQEIRNSLLSNSVKILISSLPYSSKIRSRFVTGLIYHDQERDKGYWISYSVPGKGEANKKTVLLGDTGALKKRRINLVINSKRTALERTLRHKQTNAERKLWSILRSRQFENSKFRRQEPIGKYIVDFVSLERELIIEVDGGQHNQQSEMENDETRTKWLERKGFRVIRFWNNDVLQNIDGVAYKILETINSNK
jgi:very-short-patch-repair endonuclease